MIFLGIPHYDTVCSGLVTSVAMASKKHNYAIGMENTSLLANGFNRLWCIALNSRKTRNFTHFAMHHADISAEPGWLDILMEEKERVGADILSCVVPIKDNRGITSSGWLAEDKTIRRLTMKDAYALPKTFSAADLPGPLMLNTGVMLIDLSQPWVEDVHFEIRDWIIKDDDGQFIPRVLPEDWNFSFWAHERGLKTFATTAVSLSHLGRKDYEAKGEAWGEWTTDLGDSSPTSV